MSITPNLLNDELLNLDNWSEIGGGEGDYYLVGNKLYIEGDRQLLCLLATAGLQVTIEFKVDPLTTVLYEEPDGDCIQILFLLGTKMAIIRIWSDVWGYITSGGTFVSLGASDLNETTYRIEQDASVPRFRIYKNNTLIQEVTDYSANVFGDIGNQVGFIIGTLGYGEDIDTYFCPNLKAGDGLGDFGGAPASKKVMILKN